MEMCLEHTANENKFFDYCHERYIPKKPYTGKLKSNDLLTSYFSFIRCESHFYELVNEISRKNGLNSTVWGVKKIGDQLVCEFYFYNHQKRFPVNKISNVLKLVKPFFSLSVKPYENIPYFMFSMDIVPSIFTNKKLDGVHIYIPDESGRNGFSYFFSGLHFNLENYYSFFNAKNEIDEVISKIKKTVFVDFSKIKMNEILLPKLIKCKCICVANKRGNDAIYYSGIDINQFIFFLKMFQYPEEIVSFIENKKGRLDHLQYDVGFDYKMEGGKLKIVKSGYYGTF